MREMKVNGVEWLGEVPAGWTFAPFKRLYSQVSITNCESEELLSVYLNRGVIRYVDSDGVQVHKPSKSLLKYQLVRPGNFVLNNQQAWRGSVGISIYRGIVSPAYYVLEKNTSNIDDRFANYLFRGPFVQVLELCSRGVGTIQRNISLVELKSEMVPLPPLDEQRRIADFLDERCGEIDRAVFAAERSIEELNLYRSARLEEMITRVSHEAPREKLKYVLKESKDKSPDGIGEPLSITIARGVLRSIELAIPNPTSSLVGAKIVHAGDLVFNKLKAYYGVMYVSPYNGLISPEYSVYQAIDMERTSLKYLEYVFHTAAVIDEFIIRISGVADGFRRLYTSDLFDIAVPVPSIEVQQRIVAELDDLYASIAESIGAKQAIIADLKAYKQSLIYEAVTGKREV